MNKDIKRLEEKIDNLTRKVEYPLYCFHDVECRIDARVSLCPKYPCSSPSRQIELNASEVRLNAILYRHIKQLEHEFNCTLCR